MKYFKDKENNLYVDPIEANHVGLVKITKAQFEKQVKAKNTPSAEEQLEALRSVRNSKIAETDYLLLADMPKSEAVMAYRQALRDITDTYKSLDTVVWPEKP